MGEADIYEIVRTSLNELLRWVGFGTLVGLAAKAIMPGRDPGGAVTTMLMGIGGSVIGCGTVMFFWKDASLDPISGKGFFAATFGAFMLLFFYRRMAGNFFTEADAYEDGLAHDVEQRRHLDRLTRGRRTRRRRRRGAA